MQKQNETTTKKKKQTNYYGKMKKQHDVPSSMITHEICIHIMYIVRLVSIERW